VRPATRCWQWLRWLGGSSRSTLLALLLPDVDRQAIVAALEEATAAHVLDELEGRLGHYRFHHAARVQTLEEELSLSRRVSCTVGLGEALERLYGDEAEAACSGVAWHFGEAEAIAPKARWRGIYGGRG